MCRIDDAPSHGSLPWALTLLALALALFGVGGILWEAMGYGLPEAPLTANPPSVLYFESGIVAPVFMSGGVGLVPAPYFYWRDAVMQTRSDDGAIR